ncbi:hypothetical protein [Qingshengfaniella alkalisoli]|nr:hypothetical protein [Qingshengfaniella alkalisoli]
MTKLAWSILSLALAVSVVDDADPMGLVTLTEAGMVACPVELT